MGLGGKSRQGGHFNHVMTLYILVPLLLLCRNKALDAALYLQSSPKPFSEFFLSLGRASYSFSLSQYLWEEEHHEGGRHQYWARSFL